jgi:acetoin utilization protein AcuC
MKDLIIIHDDKYENWIFDHNHPTQGRRFTKGYETLRLHAEAAGLDYETWRPYMPHRSQLEYVHAAEYVSEVIDEHKSSEWHGQRPDLSELAQLFFGGTMMGLDALRNMDTLTAAHLPGAKHHAQRDTSSGFCVFADFAAAALDIVNNDGLKVAILDIDAHHGDGTENLTCEEKNVLTYSIHQAGIFPGTGMIDDPFHCVYNWPLGDGEGDRALRQGVTDFISLTEFYKPTYIFVAGGADGHRLDPLTGLTYSIEGLESAARMVRSAFPYTPILFGGAGGYQPDGATPLAWARMVTALAS